MRIPSPLLYADFQPSPRQRDTLGELTEAFGALSASSTVPKVPMPRTEVVPYLARVDGSMIGVSGKAQSDVGKIFSLSERVSLASRWTAGTDANARAMALQQFTSTEEYIRSAGIRLAAIPSAKYATEIRDSINDNVEKFTSGSEWTDLTDSVYPQIRSAAESMYSNLAKTESSFKSTINEAATAIKDWSMPISDTASQALGSFAPVLGGLAGCGIGLLVSAIFKGLFGREEPQELHRWHSTRFRFRRHALGGSGCLVTAECFNCYCGESGEIGSGCGALQDMTGCHSCARINKSPIQTPIELPIAKDKRGRWVAWWHGGFGPHQGQNRFPPSPPWYSATTTALLEGVDDYKGVVSKLSELRTSAIDQDWQTAQAKAKQTRAILSAAGVSSVNINTLMWLYWFEPLPEEFGQVVPMSKFSSKSTSQGVIVSSLTLPEPTWDPQRLLEKVHGGLTASQWTIASVIAGAGGLGLIWAATRRR
jgi:hypothetical protein